MPGQGVVDFRVATAVECVPALTCGQIRAIQCLDFLPDLEQPNDGLPPTGATVFKHPEFFGDKLQVCPHS